MSRGRTKVCVRVLVRVRVRVRVHMRIRVRVFVLFSHTSAEAGHPIEGDAEEYGGQAQIGHFNQHQRRPVCYCPIHTCTHIPHMLAHTEPSISM